MFQLFGAYCNGTIGRSTRPRRLHTLTPAQASRSQAKEAVNVVDSWAIFGQVGGPKIGPDRLWLYWKHSYVRAPVFGNSHSGWTWDSRWE